jgi:hypothetical protein
MPPSRPRRRPVLDAAQRRAALRVLGRERLEDVLPLLARLDEDVRGRFVAHLVRVRPRGARDAVAVAFARTAIELHDRRRR